MASTSRSGAGGKIVTNRRKERLSATPYDRPPPPLPIKSPKWFSGVVVPSARAIASGAGKIISLMFTESESSSSEDEDFDSEQQGIDGEIPDEVNAVNEKNGLSSDLMPNGKIVKRTETKEIIEKLILQETFTREECNWIIELLNSRVVDSSKRSAESNLLAESPEKNQEDVEIYNKVTQEAKKWFKDKKVGSISMTELASGTSKVDSGGASPVDVARSYMKERPCWQSPTRNDDVITPFSAKLFKEGASYSVGYDSLSSSKKRSSLASGSWNIQEELQRVRAKATEEMLRTPFKKLDPLILASTASGEGIIGAGKPLSGARKVDAWVNAGVSSDPVLAALESRQYGRTSEGQSFHMAAAVSKTIQDSDVVYADDDKFHSKNPSVPNHDEEKHADPNSSGINGTTETEVTAELMGRQDLANGVSSSQPSLSAGIESKQNHEQCNEESHITRPLTEKDSVINTTTHSLANTNETYTEVPIVTETGSLASGSQNNLGLESEELLSVDMTAPSTKGEVAGKQQRKKPGNKPSRRGRGRGLVKG